MATLQDGFAAADTGGTAASAAEIRIQLEQWRTRRGLSRSALAMRLGISGTHLHNILLGRARPGPELGARIASLLARWTGQTAEAGPRPQTTP